MVSLLTQRFRQCPRTDIMIAEHKYKDAVAALIKKKRKLSDLYVEARDTPSELDLKGSTDLAVFYDKLRETRAFHVQNPNASLPSHSERHEIGSGGSSIGKSKAFIMFQQLQSWRKECESLFSDEERMGTCLDLSSCYSQFLNFSWKQPLSPSYSVFVGYLASPTMLVDSLPKEALPFSLRRSKEWLALLMSLTQSMVYFGSRSWPLFPWKLWLQEQLAEGRQAWKLGATEMPDWSLIAKEESSSLYCAYCRRVFSNENVMNAHWSGKKHQRAVKDAEKARDKDDQGASNSHKNENENENENLLEGWRFYDCHSSDKEDKTVLVSLSVRGWERAPSLSAACCLMEQVLRQLQEWMRPLLQFTEEASKRKATLTRLEIDAEYEEQMSQILQEHSWIAEAHATGENEENEGNENEGDNEEHERIYNPKGVPLGWDGKPIPYWLYKLHGLSVSYKCEICGNFSYRGRKEYESHFAERRHANGMRSLGVPNTSHFHGISQISEVLELQERLRRPKSQSAPFRPEIDEEFEDAMGNVMNRQTFEDLRRQGLL